MLIAFGVILLAFAVACFWLTRQLWTKPDENGALKLGAGLSATVGVLAGLAAVLFLGAGLTA